MRRIAQARPQILGNQKTLAQDGVGFHGWLQIASA